MATTVDSDTSSQELKNSSPKLPSKKRKRRNPNAKPRNTQLLKDKFPEIWKQLKQELYPGLNLDRISCSSHQTFIWTCTDHKTCQEHIWQRNVSVHLKNNGTCPFCQTIKKVHGVTRQYCACSVPPGHVGPKVRFRQESQYKSNLLKDTHPEIYSELNAELNPGLNLVGLSINDKKQLMWKCSKHESCDKHTWRNSTWERTKNLGHCPFCAGKSSCDCVLDSGPKTFKTCPTCNRSLELKEFIGNGESKTQKPNCNPCQNAINMFDCDLRSAMMRILLENQKCVDCGESDTTVLHHERDPTAVKPRKRASLRTAHLDNIVEEASKSQIVCTCCHQVRINNRRNPRIDQTPFVLRNKEMVKQRKLTDGKCQSCDRKVTEDNLIMFEFDHLDRSTKYKNISYLVERSSELLELELKKCQLLCANCHLRKSSVDLGFKKLTDFSKVTIEKAQEIIAKSRTNLTKAI